MCSGQISGYGVLDGIYDFTLKLEKSEDSFMEGSIQFAGQTQINQLIATTRGDTLRCQEIDQSINSLSTFLLIKKNQLYIGEWYDEIEKTVLPVVVYPSKTFPSIELMATRFSEDDSEIELRRLFDIPLSATVSIGKYIQPSSKKVTSYSKLTSFDNLTFYSPEGNIKFEKLTKSPVEEIEMHNYRYYESNFTIEALIPEFSQSFSDSLQSAVIRWKEELETDSKPVVSRRFPTRIYAICDIDFWSDELLAGSFEYVSPQGNGEGFTFIFDRKSDRFIKMDQLIRSGELTSGEKSEDSLGISFDYFGVINKAAFHAVKNRENKHSPWSELDIRLKRKLNDLIK